MCVIICCLTSQYAVFLYQAVSASEICSVLFLFVFIFGALYDSQSKATGVFVTEIVFHGKVDVICPYD